MPDRPRSWLLYPPFDEVDEWLPVGSDSEIHAAEELLRQTEAELRTAKVGGPVWRELLRRVREVQGELARLRGDEYAVELRVEARMSIGAPQPSVISHEQAGTYVVYFAEASEPATTRAFDDSSTSQAMDAEQAQIFGILTFVRPGELLFGGPNDEALHKHRLHGRGLSAYAVHEVFNSRWAALSWNYNVAVGKPGNTRQRHFLVAFHDSMLEVLADDMTSASAYRIWRELLSDLGRRAGEAPRILRPDLVYRPPG